VTPFCYRAEVLSEPGAINGRPRWCRASDRHAPVHICAPIAQHSMTKPEGLPLHKPTPEERRSFRQAESSCVNEKSEWTRVRELQQSVC
jgi:hypothetical protein